MNSTSNLLVERVSKSYVAPSGDVLEVLREVTLEMKAGDSLAILGPSGTGKSTLLHLLGTLDEPTSGRILYDGVDPFKLSQPELAKFRNGKIGMIFQDHHLLPQLTVLENALIPALAQGSISPEAVTRAKSLIERVGLTARASHFPSQLSGGERQRVAVARALLHRPLLLLADEPTGSLDRKTAESIGNLLIELQQAENAMLVTVTHTPSLAEKMQRQVSLLDGYIVRSSSEPRQLPGSDG
jgi:lipoprotein-releasing system ATP-binding protein